MFFDDAPTPFQPKRKKYEGDFIRMKYAPKEREWSSDPFNEFEAGDLVFFDEEVYRNYFLAMFKHAKSGKYFFLEQRGQGFFAHGNDLSRALWFFKIVTFNGAKYDLPIAKLAINGATTIDLKEASDEIIKEGKVLHNTNPGYNHIDLIEVAPLPDTSLKTYAARLHAKRLQELPIHEAAMLSEEDMDIIKEYCCNDVDNTELLWNDLGGAMELREAMSAEYKTDLRSKSDAQIAEAVIGSELKKITGYWPKRPDFDPDYTFQYEAPSYIRFRTPAFQEALRVVTSETFTLDNGGSPQLPEAIKRLRLSLGKSTYVMGGGGLHSTEKSVTHRADENTSLIDRDVASFYPRILLNNGWFPQHLGPAFLSVYNSIVERRLHAKEQSKLCKKAGDFDGARMWAIISDGLKITINGTFGKLGSMYSILYSPKLLMQVTITGQLSLMMLIEAIELAGLPVVSANTDGVIIKPPRHREQELAHIIAEWERTTQFETEETRYKLVASRDVNSYMALKEEAGDKTSRYFDERMGVKTKGAGVYCERGSALNSPLSKNPEYLVLNDALVAFVATGKPVADTIRECQDVRRFVAVKNVRGGGHQDGQYLGKVVRWYFAQGSFSEINYTGSGNKVGGTDGAKPLMELPDEIPSDLNHQWYIDKAYETLDKVGWFGGKSVETTLFN